MDDLLLAALYATLAGSTIPLGGFLARIERIRPAWLEHEFRHSVIAFGGGVLFAAIALVLVPEGMAALSATAALGAFGAGGVFFFLVDRLIEKRGGAGAQLLAMLLDFVPESLALGAMLTTQKSTGLLLAGLIALQNFPEGFNAFRELKAAGQLRGGVVLASFCALVLLGPLAAAIGYVWLRDLHEPLGAVMLFAAGGIFYLIFEDIAPQAKLEYHWAPPLGAVAGFMLGMLGASLVG
ncbi:MAG: divalent cation transporter [Kiloniellaceae bacterium]|mgnify:CR=1 FL=1